MTFLRSITPTETGHIVHGDGVYLRAPQLSDYSDWAELRARSRDFLTPWEPAWTSSELTRSSFRRRLKYYTRDLREDLGYAFFLFDSDNEMLLGGLTLSNVRRGVTHASTLGYWIGEPYAGQGKMTAGVRASLPFVFNTLHLRRLEAACLPRNEASIRLLERVGFIHEGLARRYLKINGVWQDHVTYALLEDDVRP